MFVACGCASWCMACNTSDVDSNNIEAELRSVIAKGLVDLDRAHGGRYMSSVANLLGVERSTVSRWRQRRSTANPEHCEQLARRWPSHFDAERLLDLHFRSMHTETSLGPLTAGLEILTEAESVFDACSAEMSREPNSPADRVINHTAFHIEQSGLVPFESDPLFGPELKSKLMKVHELQALRASQGWTIRIVVSAGSVERFAPIEKMAQRIDGPNVEIHAYGDTVPMVIAPLTVANQVVFMVHDHRRWERPGAAMLIRSRAAAAWADNYFSELIADAPFRLRSPAGIDNAGLAKYEQALMQRR